MEVRAGITSIGASAFQNTKSLTTIEIPASVTTIGNAAFAGSGISTFTVAEGSSSFKADADCKALLTSDGKTLVVFAPKECKSTPYDLRDITGDRDALYVFAVAALSVLLPVRHSGLAADGQCAVFQQFPAFVQNRLGELAGALVPGIGSFGEAGGGGFGIFCTYGNFSVLA